MMRQAWDKNRRVEKFIETYGPPDNPKPRYKRRMEFAASLVVGVTVLDVGCGVGHLYPHVTKRVLGYKGVDSSIDMIEAAHVFNPKGLFEIGDVCNLSKYPMFDTVIALSLLIHIQLKNISTVLGELWKHAKKALVFTMPIKETDETRYVKGSYPTVLTSLSRTTLNSLLANLFPSDVKVIPVPKGAFGYGLDDFFIQVRK